MGISSLSGSGRVDRTSCVPFGQIATLFSHTGDGSYHTLVNISGHGYLNYAAIAGTVSGALTIRVTVDGVVKVLAQQSFGVVSVVSRNMIDVAYQGSQDQMYIKSRFNDTSNPGYGSLLNNAAGVVQQYPYTGNAVNSYTHVIAPDSIYFTSSLLIEYMTSVASGSSSFLLTYEGGSY